VLWAWIHYRSRALALDLGRFGECSSDFVVYVIHEVALGECSRGSTLIDVIRVVRLHGPK
jgi:hypothetical protein